MICRQRKIHFSRRICINAYGRDRESVLEETEMFMSALLKQYFSSFFIIYTNLYVPKSLLKRIYSKIFAVISFGIKK